jgi:hypothetical protein
LSRKAFAKRSDCSALAEGLAAGFGGSGLLDDIGFLWLAAELSDAGPRVNSLVVNRLGSFALLLGGAARLAGVHQALEGTDILAMTSPALKMLPPPAHCHDHDHSPTRIEGRGAPCPGALVTDRR